MIYNLKTHPTKDNNTLVASELKKMAEIIDTKFNVDTDNWWIETHTLHNASATVTATDYWQYQITEMKFKLPSLPRGTTLPRADTLKNAELFLHIHLKGYYYNANRCIAPLCKIQDREGNYIDKFDLVIKAKSRENNNDRAEYLVTWHLDKHIHEAGDGVGNYIHPEYHFTFGGHRMTNATEYNFGDMLILPTPRLPHPPMDIILGIDFILHHFYSRAMRERITLLDEYKKIVRNAQLRIWRPFALSFASHWQLNTNIDPNIAPKKLFPNLID